MEKLQFIPLPDPRFPETLVQENIDTLKAWGVIPQEIAAWASRKDWGSTPGTHGLFPEEGAWPKYWRDESAVNAGENADALYSYLFLAGGTSVKRSNTESAGFDHPVFEIYGQHTAQFYRDYAPLFDGRVPVLAWGSATAAEAKRLNVAEGTPAPYPFGAMRDASVPGGSSFPTDCALRFRPGTPIVEAFRKEPFIRHFGDPEQYTQPEGVMAAPAVPATPPQPTQVSGTSPIPPPPAAPPPASGTSTYEGMDLDNSSGEAICNGIRTGWYFERPVQVVPIAASPETGRQNSPVTPWGYATASTAQRIMELMQAHTRRQLELFKGDQNPQFPMSVLQRYIGVQGQPRRVSVNAGLIASYIARSTAEVSDGKGGKKIVQTIDPHIAEALASLNAAME